MQEIVPRLMDLTAFGKRDEGACFRTEWHPHQSHSSLMWQSVRFSGIAMQAAGNNIFPARLSPTVTGDDVIQVQILETETTPTILAGIGVPFKNVLPVEFHFLNRQSIKVIQ